MALAFDLAPATDANFDDLLALRMESLRESLERIGRFDPMRAAERFRSSFRPTETRRILVDAVPAGCVGSLAEPVDAMRIEHFYMAPSFQNLGIGSAVLERLFRDLLPSVRLVRVGALRESDANRFYQRHGFLQVAETEWDIECERPANSTLPPADDSYRRGAAVTAPSRRTAR